MTKEDAILLASHIKKIMKKSDQTPIMEGLVIMYDCYLEERVKNDNGSTTENNGDTWA
jgi:hypothetical protein